MRTEGTKPVLAMFGQLYDDQLGQLSIGRRLDVCFNRIHQTIPHPTEWQTAHDVCGHNYPGGWSRSLHTTHQGPDGRTAWRPVWLLRSSLSKPQEPAHLTGLRRCAASFRVWGNILHDLGNMQCPNPWCFILNQLKNFKINTYKADGGYNSPDKMETLGETT